MKGFIMSVKVLRAVQVIAGIMLIVFGSNKFFGFLSMAPPAAEMGAFLGALFATGYMFKIIAVVEILAGLAFVVNKYVALLAVVLLPVMLNAFLAHLFLDPTGIGGAALLLILTVTIMYGYKDRYADILRA